jgi:hypothetical protein
MNHEADPTPPDFPALLAMFETAAAIAEAAYAEEEIALAAELERQSKLHDEIFILTSNR